MQVRVATRRPGTDSAGCADFPEGLPSEREGRSISPLASGLPLDKGLSSGALTLLFFCVCIMQGQGHQRVNREARVGGRPVGCAGLGPRREALGLSPSHVPRSLCRAGTKGSRSQVARKRTPDAVPEGRRRKWILGFTYHLLPHPVPMGDTAIHLAEAARNLRDSLTAPFPWYLYSTQNISETCSLLSILTTTLRIEAPISSRGDPCLLHELWSSFAPSPHTTRVAFACSQLDLVTTPCSLKPFAGFPLLGKMKVKLLKVAREALCGLVPRLLL